MKKKSKILSICIAVILLIVAVPTTISAIESTGNKILDEFIKDPQFADGISWSSQQPPKVAKEAVGFGCAAYCADYAHFCYGVKDAVSGTPFNSINEVRAGDVVIIGDRNSNGHWLVVLKRDGNKCYVAEGNCAGKVRIGWNYTISGSKFSEDSRAFNIGYHYLPACSYQAEHGDHNWSAGVCSTCGYALPHDHDLDASYSGYYSVVKGKTARFRSGPYDSCQEKDAKTSGTFYVVGRVSNRPSPSKTNYWYKTKDGLYVFSDNFEKVNPAQYATLNNTSTVGKYMIVSPSGSGLLRYAPVKSAPEVGTYSGGTLLYISSRGNSSASGNIWYRVTPATGSASNSANGYIYSDNVINLVVPGVYASNHNSNVPFYKGSPSGGQIGHLVPGEQFTVDSTYDNQWVYGHDDFGNYGYIQIGYLKFIATVSHTHQFGSATCTTPATCIHEGCNVTQGSALGHIYSNQCDTTCDRCGAVRSVSHSYLGVITAYPSCTNEGVKTYTCSCCGASYTESIPKTDHSYSGNLIGNENGHYQRCSVCSTPSTVSPHIYDDECDSTCNVCGYVRNVTHTFSEWKYANTLPANITADRYNIQTKYHCETTAKQSPGDGWIYQYYAYSDYVVTGYTDSYFELPSTDTMVLQSVVYYHYCSNNQGTTVNYYPTSVYVHYDEISDLGSVYVEKSFPDSDGSGVMAYKLKWNNGSDAYCKSGTTCNGEYGQHDQRSCYWYKKYTYQLREKTDYYLYTKDVDYTENDIGNTGNYCSKLYRYRLKSIAPENAGEYCAVCGALNPAHTHTLGVDWISDEMQHWHKCSLCGAKADVGDHVYDNDCDTICNVCGCIRTIAHEYNSIWSNDASNHWHECSVCGAKADINNHEYDDDYDTTCNTCGYVRQAKIKTGKWGDCTWTLNGTKLTISGTGKMHELPSTMPWGYEITEVVVEEGITNICRFFCKDCTELVSIKIPGSVKTINRSAFCNCTSLTEIIIPHGVSYIDLAAFEGCTNLELIVIPLSVKTIYSYAFSNCNNIKKVVYCGTEDQWKLINISKRESPELASATRQYHELVNDECIYCADVKHGLIHHDRIEPTLEAEGNIEYWTCNECGKYFSDAEGKCEITQADIVLSNLTVSGIRYSLKEKNRKWNYNLWDVYTVSYEAEQMYYARESSYKENFETYFVAPYYVFWGELSFDTDADSTTFNTDFPIYSSESEIETLGTLECPITVSKGDYIGAVHTNSEIFINTTGIYSKRISVDLYVPAGRTFELRNGVFYDATGNKCGENVTWAFDEDTETLTIAGIGDMFDYQYDVYPGFIPTPWHDLSKNKQIKHVIINEGVTSIGNYAFGCESIVEISIPSTVVKIGEAAFYYTAISSIILPENTKVLSRRAFEGCSNLTEIAIPNGVQSIDSFAFSMCDNLSIVTIPKSVISIKSSAFEFCEKLATVYYDGTSENRESIIISTGNDNFENANWIYTKTTEKFIEGEVLIEISANAIPENAEFAVAKIVPPPAEIVEKVKDTYGESSEVLAYYEIRLFDENGDRIYKLDSEITIKSILPEKYQTGYIIKISQEDDDGNLVEMESWREGEYICYNTDWLEKY